MANYITVFFVTWCMVKSIRGDIAINCTASESCGGCIQKFGCVWCADPDLVRIDRCQDEKSAKCKQFLINPKASNVTYNPVPVSKHEKTSEERNKDDKKKLKNTISTGSTSNIISITPQFINITLRPNNGHPFRIKMRYHQPPDYPLDIYYLMDSSNSLLPEKLALSFGNLGPELEKKVSKITRDLHLGFGSFVEKPVSPFVDLDPEKRLRTCENCIPAYSFRNYLPLTKDTASFSLLGIMQPNDGCCHLDKNGYYSESTNQDYPSIQQIHSKVKENAVNLIFTVPESVKVLYQKLANVIDGAFVAVKKMDATDKETIRIIKEQYESITSKIEIENSDLPEQIRIEYYSKCLNSTGPLLKRNKCEGLRINDSVEFELDIELLACPTDQSQWNRQFYIQPRGVNEKMTVNLKMLCDCQCNEEICEEHSSKCSKQGNLTHGVCECDPGFSGADCNCSSKDYNDDRNCREKPGAVICSGRGSCECNKCHCNSIAAEVFFGKFCQCSNFSCPSNQGKLCSDHGICNCNECECNEGWSNDDCSCDTNQNKCQQSSTEEICSGHGHCECNKCICNQTEGITGQFCEKYPTRYFCDIFSDCVLCKTQQNMQCTDICKGEVKLVDKLEDLHQEENTCTVSDSQNCKYRFSYEISGKEVEINVLQHRFCNAAPAPILTFVIGVISAIVLVGFLFLMMWKIFVVFQDRKEFEKFKEEQKFAMWEDDVNPLYQPASKKYRNPLFEDSIELTYKSTKND